GPMACFPAQAKEGWSKSTEKRRRRSRRRLLQFRREAMSTKRITGGICTAIALVMLLALPPAAHAQGAKTFVMKLSTATINDTQHEWLRRFTAAVEKDSGGRIKGEI